MAVDMLIGGIPATFGDPGAMSDALLAPFSSEHRRRHVKFKIDSYYQELTKGKSHNLFSSPVRSTERAESAPMLTRYGRDIQNSCNHVLGRICSPTVPLESRVRCVAYSTTLRLVVAKQMAEVRRRILFSL